MLGAPWHGGSRSVPKVLSLSLVQTFVQDRAGRSTHYTARQGSTIERGEVTTEPDLQVPGLAAQVGGGIQDDRRQHSERLSWRAGGHRAQVAQHHIVHVCAGDVSHDVDLNVAGVELCHDRILHALQGECLNLLGVGISESPV